MNSTEMLELLDPYRKELQEISAFIHGHPEMALQEHKAAQMQKKFLAAHGFKVERAGSLKTAFKASWGNPDVRKAAFLSEYDALTIGHACGHNLIAVTALAAAILYREVLRREKLDGCCMVIGTPAEEGSGGKIVMLDEGVFDDIDLCLISHPYHLSATDGGSLAVSRWAVEFRGKSSHAASAPDEGVNALDAMNLLFAGISCFRQQMKSSSRIHGIIEEGGQMPNIIPDYTRASFYLRAAEQSEIRHLEKRFKQMVEGAALMSGCKFTIKCQETPYAATKVDHELNSLLFDAAGELGMKPKAELFTGISTDFADVSQHNKGANFFFGISENYEVVPLHSEGFKTLAGSNFAFSQAMKCAAVMASCAIKTFF